MKNMSTTEKEIIGEIICAMFGERRCGKPSRYKIQYINDYCVTLCMNSEDDPFHDDMEELIDFESKQSAYLGMYRLGYAACISKPEKPIVDPVVEDYFHDIKPTNSGEIQFTVQFPINFTNVMLVISKATELEKVGLKIDYLKLMEMIEDDIAVGKYDVDDNDYI